MSHNTIVIYAADDATNSQTVKEAKAGGAITAGMLVERNGDNVRAHSTANGTASKLFALENLVIGGGIDSAYAAGDTVRFQAMRTGMVVYALVAAGTGAIAKNAFIASHGDGTVQESAAAPDDNKVFAQALEAVDNSGGSASVRIKLEIL